MQGCFRMLCEINDALPAVEVQAGGASMPGSKFNKGFLGFLDVISRKWLSGYRLDNLLFLRANTIRHVYHLR